VPRKKKSLREMTKDELAKRFFPDKGLRKKLKQVAHERDDKPVRRSS